MKIAFDVKGTLLGPKQKYVLMLLEELQGRGHEITIWSNAFPYTLDAVKVHDLKNVTTQSKYAKSELTNLFDYAIEDDTNQTWLAAKKFIWVHDIPGARGGINKLVDKMEKSE